jgi:hypothetical protein
MTALPPWWLWLFPATYVLHILEEGFAGERFYRWIRRVVRREMTAGSFFALNGAFLLATILAAFLSQLPTSRVFAASVLGTITVINGAGHLIGSIATRTYSPGAVTGALLWIPLGAASLAFAQSGSSSQATLGAIASGVAAMIAVALAALLISRRSGPP